MKYHLLLVLALLTLCLDSRAETVATAPVPVSQAGVSDSASAQPLTSIIGADAEMTIEPGPVLLGRLKGLVIQVHNGTDRPLLFDGDKAVATLGDVHIESAPLSAVDNTAYPVRTQGQKLGRAFRDTVVAASTIGAYQTVRDAKIQAGPVLKRYGWDEARRQDEITRFGKRILWPGDTSKGVVYFQTGNSLSGASVEMPVNSIYDTKDQAAIKTSR